jgi:hypothetical protein
MDRLINHVGLQDLAKWSCWGLGAVFLVVAALGFFSSSEYILGMFMVNNVHNLVHLLSGAILIAAGFAIESNARMVLWAFTGIYALVSIAGSAGWQPMVDFLHLNAADNWLHMCLTLTFASLAGISLAIHMPHGGGSMTPHTR